MSLDPQNRLDIVALTTGTSAGEGPGRRRPARFSPPSGRRSISRARGRRAPTAGQPRLVVAPSLDRPGQLRAGRRHRVPVPVGEPRREDHNHRTERSRSTRTNRRRRLPRDKSSTSSSPSRRSPTPATPTSPTAVGAIRSVAFEVKTVTTPPIDFEAATDPAIQVGAPGKYSTDDVLWVRSGGTDVPFSFVGTDLEGRKVDFTTGVIWMSSTSARIDAEPYRRRCRIRRRRREPQIPVVRRVALRVRRHSGRKARIDGAARQHLRSHGRRRRQRRGQLLSRSRLGRGQTPGAEQIVGAGSNRCASPSVSISRNYLNNGFQAGVTEVYLAVKQNAPGSRSPPTSSAGWPRPNFAVSGIARDLGPVGGDLSELIGGKFDPMKYFSMLSGGAGKLLGCHHDGRDHPAGRSERAASNAQAPRSRTISSTRTTTTRSPLQLLTSRSSGPPVVRADTPVSSSPKRARR